MRSIAWRITDDFSKAARIASRTGQLFAYVMNFAGIWIALQGKWFGGLWWVFIDKETFLRLMDIPEIKGLKHSSLDRLVELDRLSLRDAHSPDFRICFGNDLGINMIEYGSDYLLGLATFAPEKFAERDRLWEQGDSGYYALSDALQHLGNIAFRQPVPAYKHSAAIFLHRVGRSRAWRIRKTRNGHSGSWKYCEIVQYVWDMNSRSDT